MSWSTLLETMHWTGCCMLDRSPSDGWVLSGFSSGDLLSSCSLSHGQANATSQAGRSSSLRSADSGGDSDGLYGRVRGVWPLQRHRADHVDGLDDHGPSSGREPGGTPRCSGPPHGLLGTDLTGQWTDGQLDFFLHSKKIRRPLCSPTGPRQSIPGEKPLHHWQSRSGLQTR